jgi:hypothetical protein
VVGGYSESAYLNSAEVIDLETSATTCDNFTPFPHYFTGGVGGLGFRNEPLTCQGMIFLANILWWNLLEDRVI